MITSLGDVRVLDVTTSVAGPFATQILGDLGADVVKVERPGTGDDTRRWGPPFWAGHSCSFLGLNRNKRSVVVDIKDERGRADLRRLMLAADVVVQNLRPGTLAAMGLGYADVRGQNPGLIYCDMTGYGPVGPRALSPAYDPLMQAYSGLMSLTGEEGRPPVRIPAPILDQGTGMWTALAVVAALRDRDRTGRGTHIQTSLLSTALMWLPTHVLGYLADGTVPPRLGSGTVGIYPYAAFPTGDGDVVIAAANEHQWRRLCAAVDRTDLLADPRFTLNQDRVAHRGELYEELARTLRAAPTAHWTDRLEAAGVPATAVQALDTVAQDEQVAALGVFEPVEHPLIAGLRLLNLPVQADGAYPPIRRIPPQLGEHTAEVLDEWSRPRQGAS